MALTDRMIVNFKATGKPHKHFDGGGLHLHVSPTGGKLWRLYYRFHGKPRLLSFGAYPAVSLKMARDRREEAKCLLAQGVDPRDHKRELKRLAVAAVENTFEAIAREWYDKYKSRWVERTARIILSCLEKNIFPAIGKRPIAAIKAPEILAIVHSLDTRGVMCTQHRVIQYCGQVFRYGIATGRAEHDITADLRGALTSYRPKHFAPITDPRQVGQLLRAIDSYQGHFTVACALRLAPLVFVRPSELRCAEWTEFDFANAAWRIPAKCMKMGEQHLVPLARQTLEILRELKAITGCGKYLFPSLRTASRPISDNTVNAALRRLGYSKDEMTGHGLWTLLIAI